MFKHRMIGMRLILLPGVVLASLAIACADEVQIPIEQIVEVVKEVPVDEVVEVVKEVEVEKIVEVVKEVEIEKVVEVVKEVEVEKVVEVVKEIEVEKIVEVVKEVEVEKIVEVMVQPTAMPEAPAGPAIYSMGIFEEPITRNFWSYYGGPGGSVWTGYVLDGTAPTLYDYSEQRFD